MIYLELEFEEGAGDTLEDAGVAAFFEASSVSVEEGGVGVGSIARVCPSATPFFLNATRK
jgi:hypothetical protein